MYEDSSSYDIPTTVIDSRYEDLVGPQYVRKWYKLTGAYLGGLAPAFPLWGEHNFCTNILCEKIMLNFEHL